MQRLKSALIWTLFVILARILIAPLPTQHTFEESVTVFSFGTLDLNNTCALLMLVSIIAPVILLIMLLYTIYGTHLTFREMMREAISSHIFYGYITLSVIYLLDIIRDKYFQQFKSETNEWIKYILHFVLTPPLFVDSVYSVEVERIRTKSKKYNPRSLEFSTRVHYIAQAVLGVYLLYALLVILFIHNGPNFTLIDAIRYRDLESAAAIFRHTKILVNEMSWCVFTSLSMGLIDQWILFRATNRHHLVQASTK